MNKWYIISCLFLSIAGKGFTQSTAEQTVRQLMLEQQKAWNRGDLQAFMTAYWNSDSLMFIGKTGITYGWQQTLANYRKHYPDTAATGQLNLELIELRPLGDEYFFVVGHWHLARTNSKLNGTFTLLFRKINRQWLIISDHSS